MLLFLFDSKNNIILHPDAVKLAKRLSKLKKDEVGFIILAYDYYSPYNQLSEKERIEKASRQIYGEDVAKKFDITKLHEYIDDYKGLQYDLRRETIRTYKEKIISLNIEIRDEINMNALSAYTKAIKELNMLIREMELDLVTDETTRMLSEAAGASLLEQWGENQRQYKRDQERLIKAKELSEVEEVLTVKKKASRKNEF